VRQHYRLGGDPDGPPVLLQHGWAGTSYTWRRVATRLAKDSRGLVRQLGFGSGRPIVVAAHDMGARRTHWSGRAAIPKNLPRSYIEEPVCVLSFFAT
jgi:pimeloyl-ACP methyl ester carboxylesterase